MPKLKSRERYLNFCLRIPAEALEQVAAQAEAQGVKPVVLGRKIMMDWANAQQQKTPVA